MKYAFMTFSTPKLNLDDILKTARLYGYAGIEPRLDADHAHGIEVAADAGQRRKIRAEVAASGIELACLATSLSYADPEKNAAMREQTHARIDLAGDLQVPRLRVFGGLFPETVSRDKARTLIIDSLRSVAEHAAERQVTLCLETHDAWCDPNEVAAIMQAVQHPAIAVNWDIMHPVRRAASSIEQSFAILKPWIRHLHIHDGMMAESKLMPIGTGAIDHRAALACLKTIDYQGFISGEWINWEEYQIHLPREIATMQRYEKELAAPK